MRLFSFPAGACALTLAASSALLAQSGPTVPPPPRTWQVTIDASFIGVNVGVASRTSARTSMGVSIGVGGNWFNYMALAGTHFAESGGLSYEARDGAENKELIELLRGELFVRREFEQGRQVDVGIKASGFLHSDSSDDDPGGGGFIGVNVTGMWWRWHALRLGSELDIGRYSEGHPEFGVNVAPILVRLAL